jgi:L-cysteine/cystine lyase
MLHQHRAQFPALRNKTYFNYGGTGPMPKGAMDAIIQAQAQIQDIGPFSLDTYYWIQPQIAKARNTISQTLNTPTSTITLTDNVTVGCNIAMWGIDWHPGDSILLSDSEHPGIVAAAQEIGRRFAVEILYCPIQATLNQGDPVQVIAQSLKPSTRLVVLSHILWNTGQVLPLDKIVEVCHENESLLLIDAAQSAGVLPLNLTELGVDFYAFTGHKWLCGPPGVGGLYVSPAAREKLHPTFIGYAGIITDERSHPVDWLPDGRRYEVSTIATPLYIGLSEAIAIHDQWGNTVQRYEQICLNSKYLWEKLSQLSQLACLKNSPPQSGLVSFKLNGDLNNLDLVKFLEARKILTRTIANPPCVRISVHYLTLESEIDQLVAAIEEFCSL